MPDVYEGRIQAWHYFFDFPKVNIAYRELQVALYLIQLNQLLILKQGYLNFLGSGIDNQFSNNFLILAHV